MITTTKRSPKWRSGADSSHAKRGNCTSSSTITTSIMRHVRRCDCVPCLDKSSRLSQRKESFLENKKSNIDCEPQNERSHSIAGAAPLVCAFQKLVERASRTSDLNRGHAALDRTRLGHRNFFRLHATLEHEDASLDRRRVV